MNALKNVLVVGMLLAVGGGVYIAITTNPQESTPPIANSEIPTAPPPVDIVSNGTASPMPFPTSSSLANGGATPAPITRFDATRDTKAPAWSPGPALGNGASAPQVPSVASLAAPAPLPTITPGGPSSTDPPAAPAGPKPAFIPIAPQSPATGPTVTPTPDGASALEPPAASTGIRAEFVNFMGKVRDTLRERNLVRAHEVLSRFYGRPQLSLEESQQLNDLLNQVAGTVIYSQESWLDPAHVVREGETLPLIAEKYGVPWELLAKINGVTDAMGLQPGQKLKVLRGPFEAQLNLDRGEMTLILRNLYAGKFAVKMDGAHPPAEGTYSIEKKSTIPSAAPPDFAAPFAEASGPGGAACLMLTGGMVIRGPAPLPPSPDGPESAAITMQPNELQDVYDILSVGSRVIIQR